MGEGALASADPTALAAEPVGLMRTVLPIAGTEVRVVSGITFVSAGPTTEPSLRQVKEDYGHAMGDSVLAEFGRRLQTAVRRSDTVARLGGDESVVVCEDADGEGMLYSGRRLEDALPLPLSVGGVRHWLSTSIGIALGHGDPDLLRHGDPGVRLGQTRPSTGRRRGGRADRCVSVGLPAGKPRGSSHSVIASGSSRRRRTSVKNCAASAP